MAYLTEMCRALHAAEMPNEVCAILDYEVSRAFTQTAVLKLRDSVLGNGDLLVATGRNGLSRGVLLVKRMEGSRWWSAWAIEVSPSQRVSWWFEGTYISVS